MTDAWPATDKPGEPQLLASSLAHSVHKVITEADGVELLAVQMTRGALKTVIDALREAAAWHSANDSLIAAAPDMLSALLRVSVILEKSNTWCQGETHKAVLAAISKALPPPPDPASEGKE
jgi:hypothetical protein